MNTNQKLDLARQKKQVFTLKTSGFEAQVIIAQISPDGYILVVLGDNGYYKNQGFNRWRDASQNNSDAMRDLTNGGYIFNEVLGVFTKNGIVAPSFDSLYVERSKLAPVVQPTPVKRYATIPLVSPIGRPNPSLRTVVDSFRNPHPLISGIARKPSVNLPPRNSTGQFMAKKTVAYFSYRKLGETFPTHRKIVVDEDNSNGQYLRGYDVDKAGYRAFHRSRVTNLSQVKEWVDTTN